MLSTPPQNLSPWQNVLLLAGRVLIGWIYVESSFGKLMDMDRFIASLVTRHVPYASALGWLGAAVEFLGGLALVTGAFTRCAALAVIVFTVVATLIGHRYWELVEPAARRVQQANFAKNTAIIGGLILLVVTGAGRFSLDGWRKR
jgi:putative oxidoreductase